MEIKVDPSFFEHLPPPLKERITSYLDACKNAPDEQMQILQRCFAGSKGEWAGGTDE